MANGGIFAGPIERDPDNHLKIRDGATTSVPIIRDIREMSPDRAIRELKRRIEKRKAGGTEVGVMPWQAPPARGAVGTATGAAVAQFKKNGGNIETLISDDESFLPTSQNYRALASLPTHEARISVLQGAGIWTDREITQLVNDLPPVRGSTTSTAYKLLVAGGTIGASAALAPGVIFSGSFISQMMAGYAIQRHTESALKGAGVPTPIALGASFLAAGPRAAVPLVKLPFRAGFAAGRGVSGLAQPTLDPRLNTLTALRAIPGQLLGTTQEIARPALQSLDDIGAIIAAHSTNDVLKKMAHLGAAVVRTSTDNNPRAGQAYERSVKFIGGINALADEPIELAAVGYNGLIAQARARTTGMMASLSAHGSEDLLFGKLDKQGLLTGVAHGWTGIAGRTPASISQLKGVSLSDLMSDIGGAKAISLTDMQRTFIARHIEIGKEIPRMLKANGIDLPGFDDAGAWIGRRVLGRVDKNGEIVSYSTQAMQKAGRIGFEKRRAYALQARAIREGYRYLTPTEALELNILDAYRRVADKKFAEYIIKNTDSRSGALSISDAIVKSKMKAEVDLKTAREFVGLLRQARLGKPLPASSIDAMRKYLPAISGSLSTKSAGSLRSMFAAQAARAKRRRALDGLTKEEAFEGSGSRSLTERQRDAILEMKQSAGRTVKQRQEALTGAADKVLKEVKRAKAQQKELKARFPGISNEFWQAQGFKTRKTRFESLLPTETLDEFWKAQGQSRKTRRLFTADDAARIESVIMQQLETIDPNAIGKAISEVNAIPRMFTLAGDASQHLINLIMLATRMPREFAGQAYWGTRAVFDPRAFSRFMADPKHAKTVQESKALILASRGGTEITQALQPGGLLSQGWLARVSAPLKPFQRGFETSLDVSGILMREALVKPGMTSKEAVAVEGFINSIRGLVSSKALGISSNQQLFESAVLLAPRYRRATIALYADAIRGVVGAATGTDAGIRAKLAWESLRNMVLAMHGVYISIDYALARNAGLSDDQWRKELPRKLHPANPQWMTWKIAGQDIGIGSKIRSDIKFLSTTFPAIFAGAGGAVRGRDFLNIGKENPLFRYVWGQSSPVFSTTVDYVTGENFMGEPRDIILDSSQGIMDIGKEMFAENFMPIWAQGVALDGGSGWQRVLRGATEFVGLRARPNNRGDRLNTLVTELVIDEDGNPVVPDSPERVFRWTQLNRQAQRNIRRDQPLVDALDEEFSKHGREQRYFDAKQASRVRLGEMEQKVREGEVSRKDWLEARAKDKNKLRILQAEEGMQEVFEEWEARRRPDRQEKLIDDYYDLRDEVLGKGKEVSSEVELTRQDWDKWNDAEQRFLANLSGADRKYIANNTALGESEMELEYLDFIERTKNAGYYDAWRRHPVIQSRSELEPLYYEWLEKRESGQQVLAAWEQEHIGDMSTLKMIERFHRAERQRMLRNKPKLNADQFLWHEQRLYTDDAYELAMKEIDDEKLHIRYMLSTEEPGGTPLGADKAQMLRGHGIYTLRDLSMAPNEALYAAFGARTLEARLKIDGYNIQARAGDMLISIFESDE